MTVDSPGWRCAAHVRRAERGERGGRGGDGTTAGGSPAPRGGAAATRAAISATLGGGARRARPAAPPRGARRDRTAARGAPSARTRPSSSSTSARNTSSPSARTRNLSRFRCLFTRSPRAWKTRTTASASARSSPAGRNSTSGAPDVQSEEVPPATVTANPRRCGRRRRARALGSRGPGSASRRGPPRSPSNAILNLRGSAVAERVAEEVARDRLGVRRHVEGLVRGRRPRAGTRPRSGPRSRPRRRW